MNLLKYNCGDYDCLETSNEILAAIEAIAGDSILDENSIAYRIWEDGDDDDMRRVLEMALPHIADDAEMLYWGAAYFWVSDLRAGKFQVA